MSTKHIIIKIKQTDTFELAVPNGQTALTISLDQGDENRMLSTPLLMDLHNGEALLYEWSLGGK